MIRPSIKGVNYETITFTYSYILNCEWSLDSKGLSHNRFILILQSMPLICMLKINIINQYIPSHIITIGILGVPQSEGYFQIVKG